MPGLDLLAVLAASAASFAFGALWYSPVALLGVWARDSGIDPREPMPRPVLTFAGAFGLTLASALALAVILGPAPQAMNGAATGAAVGACVAGASLGINHLFARRTLLVLIIDGSFHTIRFAIMGLVLGAWP